MAVRGKLVEMYVAFEDILGGQVPNRRPKFSERLPDILLEAFFIVAALLLAFALEEWSDEQERLESASNAKVAIYAELSDNLKRLKINIPVHQKILDKLKEHVKKREENRGVEIEFEFEYSMILLSSAAWESAKMTQAVQAFSFREIKDFSQMHQMLNLFSENQNKIIDKVTDMGELRDDELLGLTKGLAHRVEILIDINADFSRALELVIAKGE